MFTDAAYAVDRRLTDDDVAAIEEAEHFSWWAWDVAAAVNPDGSPMFPEIVKTNGAGVTKSKLAWRIMRHSKRSMREIVAEQKAEAKLDKMAKLAKYIEQGYAFDKRALDNPHNGEGEE